MQRVIILILFGLALQAGAQGPWINKFTSAQSDHIEDIVVDPAGNIYVTGDMSLTMEVRLDVVIQGNLTANGDHDVLVAKFDAQGNLIWAVNAGGAQNDVGIKLALHPSGLIVTGIFTGTADLFGITRNSQGGSSDMFLALLDTSNGTASWVRTAGGPNRTVTPSGVNVDSNGDIIIAGKFSELAYFGTDTLSTVYDPWVLDFGLDAFIAKWDASGNYQWVQQGAGKHADFAVDVVSDANNNIYAAGQFSDTITFDLTHPNVSINSMFLIKFDSQGNEQWFRRCGGSTLNQVKDLHIDANGELLMLGDASGTMLWSDGTFSTINNPFPYAYFILRIDGSGSLLDDETMGSDNPVRVQSFCEQGDSLAVYGRFECSFTGWQQHYNADGLFMATGPQDLFISKHLSAGFAPLRAQQFGGTSSKRPGTITTVNGELLFCGSYENEIFFPKRNAVFGDSFTPCGWNGVVNGGYCGDPHYSKVRWSRSFGLEDAFLAKAFLEDANPYDWWDRDVSSGSCDRSRLDSLIRIEPDLDSVSVCGGLALELKVPFKLNSPASLCAMKPGTGPPVDVVWNNGVQSLFSSANSTGWYTVELSSWNGCYVWTDSIYVEVRPLPLLRVSDSTAQFTVDPLPSELLSCDTMYFWADQVTPGATFYWVNSTDSLPGAYHVFDSTDTYWLHTIHPNGCSISNSVDFTLSGAPTVPNITAVTSNLVDEYGYPMGDTVATCTPGCITGYLQSSFFVNGIPQSLDSLLTMGYISTYGCTNDSTLDPNIDIPWSTIASQTGWYPIEMMLEVRNSPCDTDVYAFTYVDSIYVLIGDAPQVNVMDAIQCPGDTISLPFSCLNCDTTVWTGPGIIWTSLNGDSIIVDDDGLYAATSFYTVSAVTCSTSTTINVGMLQPPIFSVPYDGIICPDDSVLLYTTMPGSSYTWNGPGSTVLPNNDSIYVDIPGDYYVTVEPYAGCLITNGPAEVSNFSSPFIEAVPNGTICINSTVDLQIISGPSASIQWLPPLSGSGSMQTVSQPGLYSAIVTSCGIDWTISYEVVSTTVSAQLAANYYLCDTVGVDLLGPPGGAFYQWLPSGTGGQNLHVDTSGVFQLVVTDPFGCMDTSQAINVQPNSFSGPLSGVGDTICAGDAATVLGSGSATLNWFADVGLMQLQDSTSSFSYYPTTTDTLYLLQTQNNCNSVAIPIIVVVEPAPLDPFILGDTILCEGDDLMLWVVGNSNTVFNWQTPSGPFSGDTIGPMIASFGLIGNYQVQGVIGNCASPTQSTNVIVHDSPTLPTILGDTLLCLGDTIVLNALSDPGAVITWYTPQGTFVGNPYIYNMAGAGQDGQYTCVARFPNCATDSVSVSVKLLDCFGDGPQVSNVITPNGDGSNEYILIEDPLIESAKLVIYDRWGSVVFESENERIRWSGRHYKTHERVSHGVYYYTLTGTSVFNGVFQKNGYFEVRY